ncbi:MAG: acyl-CoA dehydratase activase [Candidatus Eremiobacteraeota bacterium]|nr:acyl-CoA dehydratase activase [Candidatus Eremiobacteraeota bacterium]
MEYRVGIDIGSDTIKSVIVSEEGIEPLEPLKIKGKPLEKIREILSLVRKRIPANNGTVKGAITGRGADAFAELLSVSTVNEIDAIVETVNRLYPEVRHIIEIGAETQSYLSLHKDEKSSRLIIEDVAPGGKCAGGTGSFLDYMHKRLKYDSLDEFINVGLSVENPAGISGRCAVFAESDIVHHYQKGTPKERIVAGIHQAAARNYKSIIHKSSKPTDKVALIGGVASNRCMKHHLINELGLRAEQVVTPDLYLYLTALGAAFKAERPLFFSEAMEKVERHLTVPFDYPSMEPIKLERSVIMERPPLPEGLCHVGVAALGVDIGSVSTKAALVTKIGPEYHVLAHHYRRTEGNPIKAVQLTMKAIMEEIGEKGFAIDKIVAATTGSGRYLTAYFIGAGLIKDEITAQSSGTAASIKEKEVTIIEIGGQDSKFIQLYQGNTTDFEMNWACAAGTGALIEKHAKNLDIEIQDFGDIALKGKKPPLINSTCAVFSESALIHFQQNNVSIEDLCAGACLASAKNYFAKVVRSRPVSDFVVFQGAVAFNRGMVGAFETLLSRPIVVPPYPHLTGAIGVATLAYEAHERGSAVKAFKGFEAILGADYSLTSFQCAHCTNECHVNMFKVGDEKFYQGDRCDRYSSAQKKKEGEALPDLFEERERLLMSLYEAPARESTLGTVGIPRGLFFSDYYPFFNAFFSEAGFQVIPSERTTKKIIASGVSSTVAEPCFPIKVAHGHVASLLEKEPDYIFLPYIFSAEKPVGKNEACNICPYVQSAPDVIRRALAAEGKRTEFLTPTFMFERGEAHVKRVLRELGKTLGVKAAAVDKAYGVARRTLDEFRERISARGKEVLESLGENQMAFVIIGRPYAVHDPAVTMDVAKKVLDEGYLPLPMDFLPLEDHDTAVQWPNMYSVQGQKKLAAARMLSGRKNLHGLVVTYFGCGPDAFIDQMFKEEIDKHYLTVQIDEHTSDTGIITRIQAYLNSVGQVAPPLKASEKKAASETPLREIGEKILWVPDMNAGSAVISSVMRAFGINARVLPRSDDKGLSRARKYICGDVCLPMLHTSEDMFTHASREGFDPSKEAFFQGKSMGPCRYGMYFMLEKSIMDALHGSVDLVTLGNRNTSGGLGTFFVLTVWDGLVAHDLLEKMLFHTRPYEGEKGAADRIFSRFIDKLCVLIEKGGVDFSSFTRKAGALLSGSHLEPLEALLKEARHEFASVRSECPPKPLVGMVGEFFVRLHEPSNQSIIRSLESMGAEVWLAPLTEFFAYSNYITGQHSLDRWKDDKKAGLIIDAKMREFLGAFASRDEHRLFNATLPYLEGFDELPSHEVVELGALYVNRFFGGEAIMSMGKSEDFARRNLSGIVSVGPFNCMPSLVVSALSRELRKAHRNIPYLVMDYDGYEDSVRDMKLSMFLSQVRERHGTGTSGEAAAVPGEK